MARWPKKNSRPDVDEYGRSKLWQFCFEGNTLEIEKLLRSGISLNEGDDAGYTPLHIAIQEKRHEVVSLLIRYGADLNLPDKYGNVPLWTAINNWGNSLEIIILLLASGADPSVENHSGNSPLEVLNNIDNKEVKNLLGQND